MEARILTPRYSVSPQIAPGDLADIAAAGYTRVICNRPDREVTPDIQSDAIARAAAEAGLDFQLHELTMQTMTPQNVTRQKALIDSAEGPVLAYCRTGTRSTVIWALTQAADMPVDEIIATAARAGYQIDNLRPVLEQIASNPATIGG